MISVNLIMFSVKLITFSVNLIIMICSVLTIHFMLMIDGFSVYY